jgi:hypothetical protein
MRAVTTPAPVDAPPGRSRAPVDFDVHGLAGIRLVDASAGDAAAVRRQLGPLERPLSTQPDITIRFVDRLELDGPLTYIGAGEAAFASDAFLVLRTRHKVPARVLIPMDRIGEPLEIVCERGLTALPLLVPILNFTLLARGSLPLHAGAFRYAGNSVVVTGWSKGGKTETLLAFLEHGAEYIGDEWVYIDDEGTRTAGIPEPIRVWDWHLEQLPEGRRFVGATDRLRLGGIELLGRLERRLPGRIRRLPPGRALGRLMPVLDRQRYVDVPAETIAGGRLGRLTAGFDRLFFLVSWSSPYIGVEPIDPDEVARRMVASLQHERLDFMGYYWKFRFAFPGRASAIVERAEEIERERLRQALAGKPAYRVGHPYPVAFEALYDAISPLCR